RLAQAPHRMFAPAEVKSFQSREGDPAVLEELSFGLFGPNGPLPLHLTEIAFQRARQLDDPTMSDFLNMLQHRLIGLFYRAWAEADPVTQMDRPETDRFRRYVGALLGLADAVDEPSALHYARLGHAAQFASQT